MLRPLADVDDAPALAAKAEARLSEPPPDGIELRWNAGLRYVGQGFEVEVDARDPTDVETLAVRFHDAHEAEYGFALRGAPVEWVELRVAWEVPAPTWRFPEPTGPARTASVRMFERSGEVEADLVSRAGLRAGGVVEGPAVVVDPDATAYIPSGWRGQVEPGAVLRVRRC